MKTFVTKVGQGYRYAIEILNEGRIGIAAQMVTGLRDARKTSVLGWYIRLQARRRPQNLFQAQRPSHAIHAGVAGPR